MLEGLCYRGEHLREAMREATLPTFHHFTCGDLETFLGFLVLGVCLLGCFLGLLLLCLPRFRDHSSSFAKSNDRLSCHGAHGMGEKKHLAQVPSRLKTGLITRVLSCRLGS